MRVYSRRSVFFFLAYFLLPLDQRTLILLMKKRGVVGVLQYNCVSFFFNPFLVPADLDWAGRESRPQENCNPVRYCIGK